jgi:hydrogenase maturation protease
MTSHQLDLEFAEIVSEFDKVFFVDAAVVDSPEAVARSEIRPRVRPHTTTHHLVPGDVLALCTCLYEKSPQGVLYSIRGESFGFAEDISPRVAEAARKVADDIADLLMSGCKR